MKKRGIYSFLAAAAGLLLIFGFSSCTRDAAQQGEVCFTIPQEVFQQIAARAVTDDKEINKTSEAEILTVPDDDNLTFEISLWEKSGKIIDSQSASNTFKKWLEASANNDIKFSFQNITVGKTIYATASATAVINGETREICSSVSAPALITQGTNYIPLELTFTVVDNKDDYYGNGSIKFDITLTPDADLTDQKIGAVSLFCVDAEYADEQQFFTKKSESNTLEISNENFIELIKNAGDLIETSSGKSVFSPSDTTTIFCSPLAVLYAARDTGITDNGNGKISVKYSTDPYDTIEEDKPVYIMAVVTYSDTDQTILPEENNNFIQTQLTSYLRGYTKVESLSKKNTIDLTISQTDIPCQVTLLYDTDDENDPGYITTCIDVSVDNVNKMVKDNYHVISYDQVKAFFPDFDFRKYNFPGLATRAESADGANYGACGYVWSQCRLEGYSIYKDGSIQITTPEGLVDITATPSEDFYLNYGTVTFKAVANPGNADVTNDITWNAKLSYGGVDINSYGVDYYELDTASNSVKIKNKLVTAGTYQLFVSATYEGFTSSQTIDVEVKDGLVFDVNASDFATQFGTYDSIDSEGYPGTALQSISNNSTIKLMGTLTNESFRDVIGVLKELPSGNNYDLDMWDITGVTQLPVVNDSNGKPKLTNLLIYGLTSVVLPQSFTTIVADSFADINNTNHYLSSVTIPATLTTIEDDALCNCLSLKEINIKGGTNSLISTDTDGFIYATQGSNKTLLVAPDSYKESVTSIDFATDFPGVTKIGASVFQFDSNSNSNLTSINLAGITSVGQRAFTECNDLDTITNWEGLQYIGDYAFSLQLTELTLDSDTITIGKSIITATTVIVDFEITENNIDAVRDNICKNISFVKNLVLNKEVYLPDLETKTISGSSTHTSAVFRGFASYLETITFNNENNFKIGDYQFANFRKLTTITTNGGKINAVGNYAFYGGGTGSSATRISSIDLSACTTIGDSAFYGHVGFDDTLDLSSVQTIGEQAFATATTHSSVTTINLQSAASIGYRAFFGWTSLTTITALGDNAPDGCEIGKEAFYFNSTNTPKIVLTTIGSEEGVANLQYVKSIGESGFKYNQFVTVDFSNASKLTSLGVEAFSGSDNLTTVKFPDKNTNTNNISIGRSAFTSSPLTTLDLGNVRMIDNTAFNGNHLTSITVPASVIVLGTNPFKPASGYSPTVTLATLESGKTETWYELTYGIGMTDLWNALIASDKESITDEDIANYKTTLGENSVNSVEGSSVTTNVINGGKYYVRVITTN